jgi:S1-C subfamily serine protease
MSAETILDTLEATLAAIYQDVSPSVVNIQIAQSAGSLPSAQQEMPGQPFQQQGLGSGFVWDTDGHIVTNNHVVENADRITITFSDGTAVPGEVVGTDPHSDLAVVKVDLPADRLSPVHLGDSTDLKVGQIAVAIGNPFGLEGTMTVGFVSALGRSLPVASGTTLGGGYTIPDIIQTDAPINPGNSGGVLVNDGGQVIGVPTAIESPVRANAGIGFAVPSAIVLRVVPELISTGHYDHSWLGISGTSLNSELAEAMSLDGDQRGVLVIEVVDGGPASEAGLLGSDRAANVNGEQVRVGGDVIVAINGLAVQDFEDLVTYLARNTSARDRITLTLLRDGAERTIDVVLGRRPEESTQRVEAQPPSPHTNGAWLGISGMTVLPEIAEAMDLDSNQGGVLIGEVVQGSPASEAGLQGSTEPLELDGQTIEVGGDIIVAIEDRRVDTMQDLLTFLQASEPGQVVTLSLLRDGEAMETEVTLGER